MSFARPLPQLYFSKRCRQGESGAKIRINFLPRAAPQLPLVLPRLRICHCPLIANEWSGLGRFTTAPSGNRKKTAVETFYLLMNFSRTAIPLPLLHHREQRLRTVRQHQQLIFDCLFGSTGRPMGGLLGRHDYSVRFFTYRCPVIALDEDTTLPHVGLGEPLRSYILL